MAKTSTERSRDLRARRKTERPEKVRATKRVPGATQEDPVVVERLVDPAKSALWLAVIKLQEEVAALRGLIQRPVGVPIQGRGEALSQVAMNPAMQQLWDQSRRVDTSGLGGSVVVNPRDLAGPALAEYVRRYGPIPTAYKDLEGA